MGRGNRSGIKKNYIELFGMTGTFETPYSDYKVRYFSTYANNREQHAKALLGELKPMRERVDANKINDISALLQRDLDDLRVSKSLVPYLQNSVEGASEDSSHIAFFPAILAVLMPKNFIQSNQSNAKYPNPKKTEDSDNKYFVYELEDGSDYWELEQWVIDNSPTPIGKIKIDPNNTHVIVLDGQHRANAFRVMTGCFLEDQKSSIYEPFYNDIEPLEDYRADLPVTLIWFESPEGKMIDPKFISRELFIAVNNSARKISEGRSILLNDHEPSSLLTRFFYSKIAEEYSFNVSNNTISLLHLGFDVNSDLKDHSAHVFTLSKPEILDTVFDWCFFGSRGYTSDLSRYMVKQLNFRDWTNVFSEYFSESGDAVVTTRDEQGNRKKIVQGDFDLGIIEREFQQNTFPVFKKIFSEFNFLQPHYKATTWVQGQRETAWKGDVKKTTWDRIFKGGEGLYYSFKNLDSVEGKDYRDQCDEIEKEFMDKRSELFSPDLDKSSINSAYRSFATKAFQVGLFMTFFDYHKRSSNSDLKDSLNSFITEINKVDIVVWTNLLTDVRREFVGSMDPKKWPFYHKLILRLLESNKQKYFGNVGNKQNSPESYLFQKYFMDRCRVYARDKGKIFSEMLYSEFPSTEIENWITAEFDNVKTFFNDKLNLSNLIDFDHKKLAIQALKASLKNEIEDESDESGEE